MMYAVAIERGDHDHAFGVAVPDIPGCFSAGDTFEEAIANAREAIELQIEAALDQGRDVPLPSDPDKFVNDPQWRGWMWAFVDIAAERLDDTVERVNVTIPRRLLRVIDDAAHTAGRSRSSFLAESALLRIRSLEMLAAIQARDQSKSAP